MFACQRLYFLLLITTHGLCQPPTTTTTTTPMPTTTMQTTSPMTTEIPKLTVVDDSCQHDEKEKYKILYEHGYNLAEIQEMSLFKGTGRFPSFLGYGCNVLLWQKFETTFTQAALNCPFKGNLEEKFQTFVENDLWTKKQTNTSDPTRGSGTGSLPNEDSMGNTLLFQYICFSSQYEECIFDQERADIQGSCDGVCQCRKNIPVDKAFAYPSGLKPEKNEPTIKMDDDKHCGVRAGGLCFPKWESDCKSGAMGYNNSLESRYKLEDFLFKCEVNAGCHTQKRVCECAQGYNCGLLGENGAWCGQMEAKWSSIVWPITLLVVDKLYIYFV